MKTRSSSVLGMLQLTVRTAEGSGFLGRASSLIRDLPDVVRVRVDEPRGMLEIVYERPAPGLLRHIHEALRVAHCEPVAGKAF
jgi:hypothetical protein